MKENFKLPLAAWKAEALGPHLDCISPGFVTCGFTLVVTPLTLDFDRISAMAETTVKAERDADLVMAVSRMILGEQYFSRSVC